MSHGARLQAAWLLQAAALLLQLERQGPSDDTRGGEDDGPPPLTARQRDVARLAAEGRTARQIAERLEIGHRTVETHLVKVYAKLGISSKLELVRRATELGL